MLIKFNCVNESNLHSHRHTHENGSLWKVIRAKIQEINASLVIVSFAGLRNVEVVTVEHCRIVEHVVEFRKKKH